MDKFIVSSICCHDDHWYLEEAIRSFAPAGPCVVFVSKVAWNGTAGDYDKCVAAAEAGGAEVVLGEWTSEADHRRHALAHLRQLGCRYSLIPDGDEIIERKLLDSLLKIAHAELAERVSVTWDTYWKAADHVVRPRERFTPLMMLDVQAVEHVSVREYSKGRHLHLGCEFGIVHHLSYSGPDERISRKLSTWGHRLEVVPEWFLRVWKRWDKDPLMTGLHPTHPREYDHVERIPVPDELTRLAPRRPSVECPKPWPKISVVIPLYGGEDEIIVCLESLSNFRELLHEVIVVDDLYPDRAAEFASQFPFATLLRNETNLGFAASCNRGFEESTGEIVMFLNSDTAVPEAGLIRLIEALTASGTIAAAGPCSNRVSNGQQVPQMYSTLERMPLFAEDFALRSEEDQDMDMLVGFCFAVKRSALQEVGLFDPRFGAGTFEDNDLCYRLRRTGYRLRLAKRAFVHHEGSKSLHRRKEHPASLLQKNQRMYADRWREDLDSGFASHLPGLAAGPVVFNEAKNPAKRRKDMERLREMANVSLCMIVKDEERVLDACLKSASPFFKQIVVVDTGSSDLTKQIACRWGAEVYDYRWTDSFAEARNASLGYARGSWVFWLDADDTLPLSSGEAILRAALEAPPQVVGFIAPVQFVDDGPGSGTRVDHVKLFRNLPGVHFEGRIHEQILGSLRSRGGEIARLEAVVLHSGYDTSEEGQAKKRERDRKLLSLDLEERPNHPFVLFNLGMTAHYTGGHEEAIDWLEKCIAAASSEESHIRKAYALLAISRRELGQLEESRSALLKGLEIVGDDPELHFQLGLLLTKMERFDEAKAHYLAVQRDDHHFSSLDIGILGHKRLFNLGVVCMQMGDYEEAKKWWFEAIAAQPDLLAAYLALFEAALQKRDYDVAKQMVLQLGIREGFGELWYESGTRLTEVIGGPAFADLFFESAAKDNPTRVNAQLALAKRRLNSGREIEAAPILQACAAAGSAEASYLMGVFHVRHGDLKSALDALGLAHQLNPVHQPTIEQIARLREALKEGDS